MRDTMGLLMMANGVDISNFDANDFNEALEVLREQVSAGQVRNVRGNSYTEDLVNEDALAAICWSGDITLLNYEAGFEKWKFVFPESGATIWNDTFCVPVGSPRKTNAEILMNYYYQPEVAAEVAAWVNYVTPVEGAYEAAIEIDPELAENQLIFPNEDTLSQVQAFRTLESAEDNEFQSAFQSVVLGS
jgi:spermidine/putrescine transport system substrate-binding protein